MIINFIIMSQIQFQIVYWDQNKKIRKIKITNLLEDLVSKLIYRIRKIQKSEIKRLRKFYQITIAEGKVNWK